MESFEILKHPEYHKNVFINCPFDKEYDHLFLTVIFTVINLGLRPLSARARTGSEHRIKKICGLMEKSKYGIHDISRTSLDDVNGLPRFNMPFELGLDVGCKEFNANYRDKAFLVVVKERYDYQIFISDILGYDPLPHGNDAKCLIKIISDWVRSDLEMPELPNGKQIYENFTIFQIDYIEIKKALPEEPAFIDICHAIAKWVSSMQEQELSI